jgi:hypothetical protein
MENERGEREEHLAEERDWSRLPNEMLRLVSEKLLDFLDFINFRATCKLQLTILSIVTEIEK